MSQTPENAEAERPATDTPDSNKTEQPANDDPANDDNVAQTPDAGAGTVTAGEPGDEDVTTPEADVARLEAELASTRDKLLRAVAETENVRRRLQRDREDTARYAVSSFSRDLLGVADNLRRALDSVDAEARKDNPALENLMTGVAMTERELLAAFERNNIRRMETIGQRFDPNFHEAMFEYEDADQPAKTVCQELEAGYMLHSRALRPAKVVITKGGPKAGDPALEKSENQGDSPAVSTACEPPTGEPGEQHDEGL